MEKKEEKTRNLMEVDYFKSEHDDIVVTGMRNVLTAREISERYGEKVLYFYMQSDCYMLKTLDGINIVIRDENKKISIVLHNPGVTTRVEFSESINIFRKAGSNLVKAINKARKDDVNLVKYKKCSETRTVVI